MHSIKRQLQQYLSVILASLALRPRRIGLYKLSRAPGIVYRCAVAVELAASPSPSADAIARAIRDRFEVTPGYLDFAVRVLEGGWLEFQLRDRSLACWLQQWLEGEPVEERFQSEEKTELTDERAQFTIDYARARCCSLLRSGHRDRLIELASPQDTPPPWRWLHPQPVPWLSSSSPQVKLCLQHRAEGQLLQRLAEGADVMAGVSRGDRVKVAIALSQDLLECDRACRIWGEVKRDTPDLARARLALLAVALEAIDRLLSDSGLPRRYEL